MKPAWIEPTPRASDVEPLRAVLLGRLVDERIDLRARDKATMLARGAVPRTTQAQALLPCQPAGSALSLRGGRGAAVADPRRGDRPDAGRRRRARAGGAPGSLPSAQGRLDGGRGRPGRDALRRAARAQARRLRVRGRDRRQHAAQLLAARGRRLDPAGRDQRSHPGRHLGLPLPVEHLEPRQPGPPAAGRRPHRALLRAGDPRRRAHLRDLRRQDERPSAREHPARRARRRGVPGHLRVPDARARGRADARGHAARRLARQGARRAGGPHAGDPLRHRRASRVLARVHRGARGRRGDERRGGRGADRLRRPAARL